MNKIFKEILPNDPYQREKKELESYEKGSKDFYRILKGNLDQNDNFTELQLEALVELINIFTKEISLFEQNISKNFKAKESFKTIFLTKNKFYERILQRYSKYLSVLCFGKLKNITYINFKTLSNELKDGLSEIIDVIEKDVPKYDLLFSELDSLQNQNKKFEVYLGRDGIYAYEARRAGDIAQRRKLKVEDFSHREVIKIKPKYINYNTFIKDNYSEMDREKYLTSNEILHDQDLIIFDTGFTGSIPEQILKTLGFKDPDLNHRIKILGTNFFKNNENIDLNEIDIENMERIQSRLVKGLKPNYQNYLHVDIIEERPKKVMTATGIFEDKNGKLKPAENPYFNKIFFQYELIELTIRQYYYNREFYK